MIRWLVAFGALFSAMSVSVVLKQAWLSRARGGEQFDDYVASFGPGEHPVDVQRAVFEFLRGRLWIKFPIRASDSIEREFGIVGEDLDDAVRSIAEACGREAVPSERRLLTLLDLVSLVENFPPRGSGAHGAAT
jgi:hypothetical protein